MDAVRTQLAESAAAFKAVFKNANLRRLTFAAAGSEIGHWAYATAVSVYAFNAGGAKAVGLLWVIRMVPSALAAPFAAMLGDRFKREWVMLASDLVRVVLIVAAAVAVWADSPVAVVYVLAALISVVSQAFEPAQRAIIASLSDTPTELTAANVVSSSIESLGFFIGPAVAGVLLVWVSIPTVFMITAGTIIWSAFFISRIHSPGEEPSGEAEEPEEAVKGFASEISAGFSALATDQRLRILVGLLAATAIVVGVFEVLIVSLAIDFLDMGESGVGYLNAGFGVGALIGAVVAAAPVGLRRLSIPFVGGGLLMGLPLLVLALVDKPIVAIICLGLLGVGNTLVDVSGFTLIQRAVPDEILARTFGALNLAFVGSVAIGAAVAPALINGLDIRNTLIVMACFMPVLLLIFGRRLVLIDTAATAPATDRMELLRRTPIFAPLPGATLEGLAARLIPLQVEQGSEIIREGDHGDRFYLVAEGQVDVTSQGSHVSTLGPGDHVGEIALLHDVPRTATVTAKTPVSLYALERDDFLSTIGSEPLSREAAESGAASRLVGLRRATGGVALPRV